MALLTLILFMAVFPGILCGNAELVNPCDQLRFLGTELCPEISIDGTDVVSSDSHMAGGTHVTINLNIVVPIAILLVLVILYAVIVLVYHYYCKMSWISALRIPFGRGAYSLCHHCVIHINHTNPQVAESSV